MHVFVVYITHNSYNMLMKILTKLMKILTKLMKILTKLMKILTKLMIAERMLTMIVIMYPRTPREVN